MRNVFLSFVLAVLGGVMSSQAVVISWASENLASGTVSARLVYVTSGAPTYGVSGLQNAGGAELATASGLAIDGTMLYEQTTTDGTTRTGGAYYIVLFNSGASQYAVSTTSIAWDDARLGTSEMDPPETFIVGSFGNWTPVPEPSALALLGLGVSALALRRRKRV